MGSGRTNLKGRIMAQKNTTVKMPKKLPPATQSPKSPNIMTAFLSRIARLAEMGKTMDLGGELQTVVRSPGKRGGFKQNQRMERKRSRVRKMKPSAR